MKKFHFFVTVLAVSLAFMLVACHKINTEPVSTSGVSKATSHVKTQSNGLTVEQTNITKKTELENQPMSIKHLYIFTQTGAVLLYSTVVGKVTSSSKRLTPYEITSMSPNGSRNLTYPGFPFQVGQDVAYTKEVLQDDGTYGSSIPYLYWFDVRGAFHSQYAEGCIIHISDQPIAVKNIIINIETVNR